MLLLIVSIVGPISLGGWLFSAEAMAPKFSRMNPLAGLKRMFSTDALVELLKAFLVSTTLTGEQIGWKIAIHLTFVISGENRTVPVAIALLQGASQYELPWGSIMAASVTVTLPIIVMVLIFQKRIVGGLTAGAVKG